MTTDIEREIAMRTSVLMLVDGLTRDVAEARAIEEIVREEKTKATARPKPALLATASRVSNAVRADAAWVTGKLLGTFRLVMPKRAYAPPASPPRKRSARANVAAPTPDPAAQPPPRSAAPLVYTSARHEPNFIDAEFESDARFRRIDEATRNWRAQNR